MEFSNTSDIIEEIYKKYDSGSRNLAGVTKNITHISYLKITIEDPPFRIQNSGGEIVIGNNISSNKFTKNITIYGDVREYVFDERIIFTKGDTLKLLGDLEGKKNSVNATIDFIYHLKTEPYVGKEIKTRELRSGMGQTFETYQAGDSIYRDIYYKYYLETMHQL